MKYVLCLFGLILLLSGCVVDPQSFALIPTPTPVHIPPHFAQHLNSLKYLDWVPAYFINEQGEPVTVLDVEQMRNDRWLQLWAMTAMENDGSLGLRKTIEKGEIPDMSMDDHQIAVIYMNAFATAELRCIENREEVAILVGTFADEAKDLEYFQFPRLTVIHELAARLTMIYESSVGETNCNDYLASLPEFPDVRAFCFGDGTLFGAVQVRGQKAQKERFEAYVEGLAASRQSLPVLLANANCLTGVDN